MKTNRRQFIKTSAAAATGITLSTGSLMANVKSSQAKKITIAEVSSDFEREPLIRPFGFKGGYMTEIWQTFFFFFLVRCAGICRTLRKWW